MINVAIVDDEQAVRKQLAEYVDKYAAESGIECGVKCFDSALSFVNRDKHAFDLILLDIEMPDVSGMELASQIRKTDTSVAIIFVTNMAQYAIRGYEVDASDFIVKPISYGDFAMKVGRIFRRIVQRRDTQITVTDGDTAKRIPVSDIRYVEVQGHALTYHMRDCVITERGTLKKREEALLDSGFARCNNYCLVNLRFVSAVNGYTVFVSGGSGRAAESLSISHPRKKDFIRVLNEYWQANM